MPAFIDYRRACAGSSKGLGLQRAWVRKSKLCRARCSHVRITKRQDALRRCTDQECGCRPTLGDSPPRGEWLVRHDNSWRRSWDANADFSQRRVRATAVRQCGCQTLVHHRQRKRGDCDLAKPVAHDSAGSDLKALKFAAFKVRLKVWLKARCRITISRDDGFSC